MVLLSEGEDEMRSMIERLEAYLDRKRLELNPSKSKIMRFRKGGGRVGKRTWRWKGKVMEEVKEFNYLGYRLQRNGGQEAHIKERIRKAAAVMGQVWGIGKRRFGGDWGRRLWLFDKLVWTVLGYGVEIWGWEEREGMERLEEKYLKWVLGVEGKTPGYLIREELQRVKLRGRAGSRAWGFEKRLEEGKGGHLARMCWKEMRERWKEGKTGSSWEMGRRKFFEDKGIKIEEVERRRGEGEMWFGELLARDREEQRKERWKKIGESKYNKWYKEVKGEGIPGYLKKGWGENRWGRVARFRLGSEMLGNRYWEAEEKITCRICGGETETWEHVWEGCREWTSGGGSWQDELGWVLGEEGEVLLVALSEEIGENGNGGLLDSEVHLWFANNRIKGVTIDDNTPDNECFLHDADNDGMSKSWTKWATIVYNQAEKIASQSIDGTTVNDFYDIEVAQKVRLLMGSDARNRSQATRNRSGENDAHKRKPRTCELGVSASFG
ncbi:hypothetical protein RF55_8945 [Lasius niger]|uniref:Uncharacterized protein n=1 Tax=Lasius niger TaxID=67767 RepID=A0A0J7KLQ5_LASNI|nr:hypothetical protein RF55_8945 [Lasius niger]